MDKDLQIASNQPPQKAQPVPVTLTQTGNDNTQIAYVQNYDGTTNQPVFIIPEQKAFMTSQNHSYVVDRDTISEKWGKMSMVVHSLDHHRRLRATIGPSQTLSSSSTTF